jgi:hypothetical protein
MVQSLLQTQHCEIPVYNSCGTFGLVGQEESPVRSKLITQPNFTLHIFNVVALYLFSIVTVAFGAK